MATKRKSILDDLLTRFRSIKKTNGYATDIVTVERHRDTDENPFDLSEVWAVNVRDGVASVDHMVSDDEHHLPVVLDIVTTSRATVTEIENAIADVTRCIDLHNDWGSNADGTTVESHGIDRAQVGEIVFAASVEITIHYTTDKGKI